MCALQWARARPEIAKRLWGNYTECPFSGRHHLMLNAVSEIQRITAGPRPLSASALGRLAVLRHEVGARTIRTPLSTMPPVPVEDLFDGVVGVPEVFGSELTGAHVASGLRHHGAIVVRNLVAPAYIAQLTALIDGRDWSTPLCPVDANGEPLKGSAPMKCSAASLQGLIDAYESAGMHAVMADYLGEPPVLLSERLQVDRQILKDGLSWHQDAGFFGVGVGGVNSFLALDHCGKEAPGLSLVARRFDRIIGVEEGKRAILTYGNSLKREHVIKLAGPGGIITPILRPGDAILFDEMTLHRTGSGPKLTKARTWAITWFFGPSRFPESRHPLSFGF